MEFRRQLLISYISHNQITLTETTLTEYLARKVNGGYIKLCSSGMTKTTSVPVVSGVLGSM
jgi:hypothetical protein